MLNDLIVESREHLEKIEPDLLELEEKGNNVSDELINRVFRAVHSIKGGFGFFGIDNIVNLSHAMENIMSRVRDKKLDVSGDVMDALLSGIDKLRTLLDDVANCEEISIEDEVEALTPFLGDVKITKKPKKNNVITSEQTETENEISKKHPDLNEEHYLNTVRNGKLLYQITINPVKDVYEKDQKLESFLVNWEHFGEIIDSNPKLDTIYKKKGKALHKKPFSLIYCTVLEADLISEAIEIGEEQIFSMDLSKYKEKVLALRKKEEEKQGKNKNTTLKNEKSAKKETKHETKIEDALRVKVSLLNNLMNFASELVLGRNQLTQTMSRKLSDSQRTEKAVKDIVEIHRKSIETIANKSHGTQLNIESELNHFESRLKDALGFQLSDLSGINSIVQNIDMVTTMLQESIMQTRMQPIAVVFSKFPRVIRDLAKKLGKEISLTQIGQEVELDKSIIELLSDPLIHLIRNCADHGIESIQDRENAGKDRKGEVILKAYQEGGKVIIDIKDDGAGIDPERIRQKALEKGVITIEQGEEMTVREIQMLIFAPGFSTVEKVSDVSGRGVGMDVVKTNIEKLGGTIDIDSEPGSGTKISLKLPLTLAIIPSLIVTAEHRRFAVPQVGLEEVVRIRAKDVTSKIESVHNSEVLRLRGKLLPLVRLGDVLGLQPTFKHPVTGEILPDKRRRLSDRRGIPLNGEEEEEEISVPIPQDIQDKRTGKVDRRVNVQNAVKVLVLRLDSRLYGLIVEDVQDSEEIVVKPLPEYLKASQAYAGVTIMGDGRVAMILDPNGVAEMAELRFDVLENDIEAEKKRVEKEDNAKLENMLIFSIGGPELLAIDLSKVSRIEKRKSIEIEHVGSKEFLKYEESSMRIFRIENYLPITPPPEEIDNMFIIVPKNAKYPLGLITSRVDDTVETELKIDTRSVHGVGVKGSAIINKKMTIVLDVDSFLDTVETEFDQ